MAEPAWDTCRDAGAAAASGASLCQALSALPGNHCCPTSHLSLPSGSGKPFPGARPRRPLARVSLSQQLLLLPAAGPKLQVDFLPLAPAQPRARASTLPWSSAGAAFVRPQRSGRSSELPFVSPPAAGRAGGAGPGPGQPRPSRLWDTAAAAPAFQPCTRSHTSLQSRGHATQLTGR